MDKHSAGRLVREIGNAQPSRRDILAGAAASGLLTGAATTIGVRRAFAQADKPRRGGTMRIAFVGSPARLDPHQMNGTEEVALTHSIYDGLTYTDHTLTPQPELATSWESTPDAKVWTFRLRQGVKFHHGRALDADDVVWSYKRILDPAVASPARSVFSLIDSVEKVDAATVRFTLTGPFAEFANLVGGNFQAKIVPRDVADLHKTPTGTGPFKLAEFVPGDHATLVRNDAYWNEGQPYLDQVRHLYLPEEASHLAGLLSGHIDMAWSPLPEMLPIYATSKDVKILVAPTNGYQPIVMAVHQPPFNDARVRRAFRLMCDRKALTRIVLGSLDVPVSNDHPIPPQSDMYMAQEPLKQDLEQAKALLAEAGYKDGMDIEMMAWTGRAGLVQSALGFQDMAKKANVRISVNTVPSDVFLGKYWLKHNFFVTNWSARTTLYELLSITYASNAKWNESHWNSRELDALIEAIRSEQDAAKRKAHFGEVQKMFIAEGPVIIPYHRPRVSAIRANVQGYQEHPSAWVDLRTTWLS